MALLTTQPSSAKMLSLSDVLKISEPAPLGHQQMVNGQLHTVSTLPHDAELLLTLLSPGLSKWRLVSHVGGENNDPHLYVRAQGPSGKGEIFQFSLKEYKLTRKPYLSLEILDGRDTLVEQLHTFLGSNKVVKDDDLADDEKYSDSNLEYQDQEMAESNLIGAPDHGKVKRSLRLPRSPVTSRGFLGEFSGLYSFGVDEAQGERPFHVPTGYDGSEISVNPHATNNHQQYRRDGQWRTHTTLYPLQQSNSFQGRNGRGKTVSQGAVRNRESFRSGGYAHVTLGSDYDKKNTFHENLGNYDSQTKVSQKSTLQNKKRDLSRQHVTIGENLDTGNAHQAALHRSTSPEESNVYSRPNLRNTLTGVIIRGGEHWDKRHRSDFGQQFGSLSQDEFISLTSQHNIPVAVSDQVLTVSPVVDKPSAYDQTLESVPLAEDVFSSVDEGALVLETGEQQKFWLGYDSGLLHDDIFSRPDDHSGFSPISEHHTGLRIFKRSAGTGGLRKSGVAHLVQQMQEGPESHISGSLSKRSPLSHGYVAGIGVDVDHHQNHDHLEGAATGSALHQVHHHDHIPPAVVLSSEHHHADTAHHLVAKSETTVGGSAGGAGGGRGPNHDDSAAAALVVLHPPHPLVAAHADDDTIHVIAAVPFAVAHHHELHHEADHVLSKSTTLALAQHDTDPHVLAKTTTVTTLTQHETAPLLVVHAADAPVVLLHHPPVSQSSTSTTTVHKPLAPHNLFREPLGGFGVGVTFGGAGAGHGFYAAG